MFSPCKAPVPGKKAVTRNKIKEIYYTTHVDNLDSILDIGIQSRNAAIQKGVLHTEHDISNPDVQRLREQKSICSPHDNHNHLLHDYVNLYPQPFNAMMATIRLSKPDMPLCVLRISADVLNIPGTLITNKNAACSNMKTYTPSDWTLPPKEFEAIRSLSVTGSETKERESTHQLFKKTRQLEVLVLNSVLPRHIHGIFVPNKNLKQQVEAITGGIFPLVEVNESLFLCDPATRKLRLFKPISSKRERENIEPTNAFSIMMAPGQKKQREAIVITL